MAKRKRRDTTTSQRPASRSRPMIHVTLSPVAIEGLDALVNRLGLAKSQVVELLVREELERRGLLEELLG